MEIKYGRAGLELRNNFPYCNVSIFGRGFELKFKEALMSWIPLKFDCKFLELKNLMRFGQQAPLYTSCNKNYSKCWGSVVRVSCLTKIVIKVINDL
jgi:hypothetical protein